MLSIGLGIALGLYFLRKIKDVLGKILGFLFFFIIGFAIGVFPDIIAFDVNLYRPTIPHTFLVLLFTFLSAYLIIQGGVFQHSNPTKIFIKNIYRVAIFMFLASFVASYFYFMEGDFHQANFFVFINLTLVPTLSFFFIASILQKRSKEIDQEGIKHTLFIPVLFAFISLLALQCAYTEYM
jgi:hypothetical protein